MLDSGIAEGSTVLLSDLETLIDKSEKQGAETKAFELMAIAPHSKAGLRRKLLQRKFGASAVEHAIERMLEHEYLDDNAFAEQWLESRIRRHPEGRFALLAGLLRKGIAHTTAEECLGRLVSAAVEREMADRFLEKLTAGKSLTLIQICKKLSGRGFSPAVIRQIRADRQPY